jgi:TusA-related sulfurtransferase
MKGTIVNFEYLKIRVNQIADARGVVFNKQLYFIEEALERLEKGQVLSIYCSDYNNKDNMPLWIENHGHTYLSIIDKTSYFKILIRKG